MTKKDFLDWIARFKYAGHWRARVEHGRFSEAELEWLHKKLSGSLKMKAEYKKARGA